MTLTQVNSAGIADGAIVNGDINNSAAVALSKLATSGTASSSNYLRGDGAWSAIDLSTKLNLTGGTLTGNVIHNDGVKALFGTSSDLQIFHNGSHSIIADVGTGNLQLRAADFRVTDSTNAEVMIKADTNGAVELYHNNLKRFETTSYGSAHTGVMRFENSGDGISLYDSRELKFGNGDDLKIWHNASSSYISNNTGNLYIESKSGETAIQIVPDGAVDLRYNGSKKFETLTGGAKISGDLTLNDTTPKITLEDNDSGDYRSRWWVSGNATVVDFDSEATGGSPYLKVQGGGVEKLRITSSGNLLIPNDTGRIKLGTGSDLQIYHNGSGSFIENAGTGSLNLYGDEVGILNKAKSEWKANFVTNGAVQLYYDGSQKFVSTSAGVQCQANTDIRFTNGSWTGEHAGKIQHHSNWLYMQGGSNGIIFRHTNGTNRWVINSNGDFYPNANNTYDIGTSSYRVKNIYVNDLQLSNESKKDTGGNDVDGTWGDWTLQEGEEDIFMINNRSKKRYKMVLQEVN